MRRVCTGSQVASLPTPNAASGTPGFFNTTAPGPSVAPTVPGPDWFNVLQEELMAVLTAASVSPDNTGATLTQLLLSMQKLGMGAGLIGEQWITSSGNFTVPANIYWIEEEAFGAGGGGGSVSGSGKNGGGGGGGGWARKWLAVTPGQVIAATIGAGGAGVSSGGGGPGGTGGATTFGGLTANGGAGGGTDSGSGGTGGAGGTASGGFINRTGRGGQGAPSGGSLLIISGAGGDNGFGWPGANPSQSGGNAGFWEGTGGSGGANTGTNQGGNGGGGLVRVRW